MNQRLITLIVIVCTAAAFMVNGFANSHHAQAESMKEHVKKSMEKTKKREKNLRDFYLAVHEQLRKKGHDIHLNISIDRLFSDEKPFITAQVKDKEYKAKYDDEIKQIIEEQVKTHKLGHVAVKVEVDKPHKISEQDRQLIIETREIHDITRDVLLQKGYKVRSIGTQPRSQKRVIKIEIEGTEQYYNSVKNDIKKRVHDAIYSKKHIDYTVKVNRQTEAEIRDMKWEPIFRAIMEETDKEFSEVTGFGFSFHPMPLQIIIKTSLPQHKPSSNKRAKIIEKYVKQIVEIKREELSLEKTPYKVFVRGNENKRLN